MGSRKNRPMNRFDVALGIIKANPGFDANEIAREISKHYGGRRVATDEVKELIDFLVETVGIVLTVKKKNGKLIMPRRQLVNLIKNAEGTLTITYQTKKGNMRTHSGDLISHELNADGNWILKTINDKHKTITPMGVKGVVTQNNSFVVE